jgi:hypothetical protein
VLRSYPGEAKERKKPAFGGKEGYRKLQLLWSADMGTAERTVCRATDGAPIRIMNAIKIYIVISEPNFVLLLSYRIQ